MSYTVPTMWTVLAALHVVLSTTLLAGGTAGRDRLTAVAGRYGFPAPMRLGDNFVLKSEYSILQFTRNSRKIKFNNTLIWLNAPLALNSRDWSFSRYDSDYTLDPLLRASSVLKGADITTIVLDPGHGGHDTGAIGYRRVYEKKAVFDIAKRVRKHLNDADFVVRMTRESDVFIPLQDRTRKAKRWGADLFVSIHLNSSPDTSASGIETFVCTGPGFASTSGGRPNKRHYPGNDYDKANMLLGYFVHRALLKQGGGNDRGVKRARFDVLRAAPCPAVLVECGFISNRSEATKILSSRRRETLARGIADGVLEYAKKAREE